MERWCGTLQISEYLTVGTLILLKNTLLHENLFVVDEMGFSARRKGILTRNRTPKSSALQIRKRYWSLAAVLDGVTVPDDLYDYVINNI